MSERIETQRLIGKILEDVIPGRDAVHIAIIPMKAAEKLYPGQHVTAKGEALRTGVNAAVGIADPFLMMPIHPEQVFLLFLYPNTITGMRHQWEHPAFSSEDVIGNRVESEKWLREFAEEWRFRNFEKMIADAVEGDYVTAGTEMYGELSQEDQNRFWYHLEVYTGKRFSPEHREGLTWACSC